MNESIPVLIALFASCSIFAMMMGLRSRSTGAIRVTAAAAHIQMTATSVRELELAKPWRERVLRPVLRSLYGLGRLLTPNRNFEQIQQDLVRAGLLERLTVIDFLGLRFLTAAMTGGGMFLYTSATRPLFSALLLALAGFGIGLYVPNFWLKMQIAKRQKAITRALPDALDRMSICVDAGLSFEAAMQKVAAYGSDDLATEFGRTIGEIRLGIPRGEALRHLVDRIGVPDVASFVAVLIQAEKLGTAVRDVLHVQSEQMRIRRRQRAEESAQKAPIKMMIPLVLFIFPAMFAVILGPAIPRILAAFQ
jgi:tight adherence protein C